jgi:Zn-dependent M16 (insulinase) family peptidase
LAAARKQASGAKLAHVYAKDANKTFAAVFRTPPTNDTGVPHILEHTVLCGSEAFPVRDPFFKMCVLRDRVFPRAAGG